MTPEESEQLKHNNSACWNYVLMQSNSDNQGKACCSVSGYFFFSQRLVLSLSLITLPSSQ